LVHERKNLTAEETIEENIAQSSGFNEESDDEMLDPNIEILKFKTVEFELVQNENNDIVGLEAREFDDSKEVQNVTTSLLGPNIQILENRLEAESKVKTETEPKSRIESEAKVLAEDEEQARLKAEAKTKSEENARLKVEEKTKLKAEAETKAKTIAEEQVRLEAEAKVKARLEDEAKAKKEEKVRLEAEAEEKLRLEAEAKAELEEKAKLEVRGFHKEKARLLKEAESKVKAEENAKLEVEEQTRLEAEANALLSKFKCSYCKEDFSSNSDLSHHMLLPPCFYLQDEAGLPGSLFGIVEDESVFTGYFE
jgi:hypothetical protein